MASKTIEGAFPAILTSEQEYQDLLKRENIRCLVDAKGHRIYGFSALKDGEVYTAGPELAEAKGNNDALIVELLAIKREMQPFLQDFNAKRRKELVPWDRESLRTKERSEAFKQSLIEYYGRAVPEETKTTFLRCQVLDSAVPSKHIIAAHIWKRETRGEGLSHFGIPESKIDNPRNGLLLCKNIEQAFDHMGVCFLYNFLHNALILHVCDQRLMKLPLYKGSSALFAHVHGRSLLGKFMPYRRLLSWHAYNALVLWGQMKVYVPYHRLSESHVGYKFPNDPDDPNDPYIAMLQSGANASDNEGDDGEM